MVPAWVDHILVEYSWGVGIAIFAAGVLKLADEMEYTWWMLVIIGLALFTIGNVLQQRFEKQ